MINNANLHPFIIKTILKDMAEQANIAYGKMVAADRQAYKESLDKIEE